MRYILLIALLLISTATQAAALDTEDKWLMYGGAAAIVADWGTTLDIENHADIYESNHYLGEHPGRGQVNRYFTGLLAIHFGVEYLIGQIESPSQRKFARRLHDYTIIYIHGGASISNMRLGLKFNF